MYVIFYVSAKTGNGIEPTAKIMFGTDGGKKEYSSYVLALSNTQYLYVDNL